MSEQKEQSKNNQPVKFFDWRFAIAIGAFVTLVFFICFFPLWFADFHFSNLKDISQKGAIGDTIGGTMGPFIAIVASGLTFLAFWAQYKANQVQIHQFKEQKKQFDKQLEEEKRQFSEQLKSQKQSEQLERFENKYYELLRIHRSNMEEMNIGREISGRKSFVTMYNEFRFCFDICDSINKNQPIEKQLTQEKLTEFSYKIFFFGIGSVSEKNLRLYEDEAYLFGLLKKGIEPVISHFVTLEQRPNHLKLPYILTYTKNNREQITFDAYYYPFDGHVSRLAHYYRHLFQTVKFVVNQKSELISEGKKLEYLQTLRAQLSNHEQVMLYYNGISGPGKAWFDKNYFTIYKMIHNLPFNLADFGIKPHDHPKIQEGIKYWENKGGHLFELDEE